MPKAICADRPGGIEVLDWREIETPHLGPDDALIHQTKIGLNFIDVYMNFLISCTAFVLLRILCTPDESRAIWRATIPPASPHAPRNTTKT